VPTYDYRCIACGHEIEVIHGVHGRGPDDCPKCGGEMRKAFVVPTIHYKGSGWAKKDRGASSATKAARSGSGDGGSKTGDEGGSKTGDEGGSKTADEGGSKTADEGGSKTGDGGGIKTGADTAPSERRRSAETTKRAAASAGPTDGGS
jgi:putative FmdB family regulatory protein